VRIHRQGLSVLLVEQNVMQSLQIAQRAYILEGGECALSGTAAEMQDNPDLKRAYLGM
jgi:branched-chain amino acid transport system ATP-binding protein